MIMFDILIALTLFYERMISMYDELLEMRIEFSSDNIPFEEQGEFIIPAYYLIDMQITGITETRQLLSNQHAKITGKYNQVAFAAFAERTTFTLASNADSHYVFSPLSSLDNRPITTPPSFFSFLESHEVVKLVLTYRNGPDDEIFVSDSYSLSSKYKDFRLHRTDEGALEVTLESD